MKLFYYKQVKYPLFLLFAIIISSCGKENKVPNQNSFKLTIDGSSTVYPITSTIVDSYQKQFDDIAFSINVTGTGEGLQKFSKNQIPFCNASRIISESEIKACENNGVKFQEIKIGFDGIAIVVNKENSWVKGLTVKQLKRIWAEENIKWSDVESSWPAEKIEKFSPGNSSGTYDYFKEVILDSLDYSGDITKSENDNLLVKGVESTRNSIAFFGLSYFEKNKTSIKSLPIKMDAEYIEPNPINIENGSYHTLSRPLYIYVNQAFLSQPVGQKFLRFYIENVTKACQQNGTVPQSPQYLQTELLKLTN